MKGPIVPQIVQNHARFFIHLASSAGAVLIGD